MNTLYKPAFVHALPTDKADFPCLGLMESHDDRWVYIKDKEDRYETMFYTPHHIYFTAPSIQEDAENGMNIKKGEWYIHTVDNILGFADLGDINNDKYRRKVLATDNKDLWNERWVNFSYGGYVYDVPKIPSSFIQQFAESGGSIKEVMLKYKLSKSMNKRQFPDILELTNAGEVIVKPVQEKLFTVREIMAKLEKLAPRLVNDEYTNPFLYRDIERWYNELKASL